MSVFRRVIDSHLKREAGFTLIETVVGLAIIVSAGVALVSGLATSFNADNIHRNQVTGEILARSTMEYITTQPYSGAPWSYNVTSSERNSDQQPSWWDSSNPPLLSDNFTGYSVSVNSDDFDADADGLLEIPGDDSGLRKVTVRVFCPETKLLVTLDTYKANR